MEGYYTGEGEESMLDELRNIGADLPKRPMPELSGEPEFGDDNFSIIYRARARKAEDLKHQVDLNDASQLADLEDSGLMAHMDDARKLLADHVRNEAVLPHAEELQRCDAATRRSLSGIVTGLKSQQGGLQVAYNEILLQAANAQKLATGRHPHGYPAPPSQSLSAQNLEFLGTKTLSVGEDLAGVIAGIEDLERALTITRRAYENTVEGLTRRCRFFEKAYETLAAAIPIK